MAASLPDDELARARLAWISAGQPALSAPRRALDVPEHPPREQGPPDGAPTAPGARAPGSGSAALPAAVTGLLEAGLRRRYVVAVLVLLLAGLGATMAVLGRSSASQVELEAPPVLRSSAAPPTASPSSAPPSLRVHVLGAVAAPGVVAVAEGSIVADALTAAGGLLAEADPAQLNLAARLADGQQIIVGTKADPRGDLRDPTPPSTRGGVGDDLVNLNTATGPQLEELPGVGPVLAGEIIGWREANGGFGAVADLQEVPGIGPRTFATLELLVTV